MSYSPSRSAKRADLVEVFLHEPSTLIRDPGVNEADDQLVCYSTNGVDRVSLRSKVHVWVSIYIVLATRGHALKVSRADQGSARREAAGMRPWHPLHSQEACTLASRLVHHIGKCRGYHASRPYPSVSSRPD